MNFHCGFFASFIMFLGRVCLSLIFIVAGYGKITAFAATSALMTAKGVPFADFLLVLAILFELGGGLLVFFGLFTRFGALLLFLFVLPVTYFFHSFWGFDGVAMMNQFHHFFKNFAIMGGTLYIMACGPGRFSIDALLGRGQCVKCDSDKQG